MQWGLPQWASDDYLTDPSYYYCDDVEVNEDDDCEDDDNTLP